MIDEVVAGRVCDSLVVAQRRQIDFGDSVVHSLIGQNENLSRQVELWKYQAVNWQHAYNKSVKQSSLDRKSMRATGRKEGAFAVATLVLLIALIQ